MEKVLSKILLVEDNLLIAECITDLLQAKGYQTLHAMSGEAGWHKFIAHRDDIYAVLCDGNIAPSDTTPVDLVRLLKQEHAEVLFIPISSTEKWNQDMLEAGASGPAFPKPIDYRKLLERFP